MGLMDFLRPKSDAVQAKPKSTLTSLFEGPEGGDRLRYLGAYFRDLDNGGMTDAQGEARQMIAQEHEAAAKKKTQAAAQQAISEAMKGAYGDNGKFDPMLFAQNMLGSGSLSDAGDVLNFAKAAKPEPVNPQILNTRRGIFQYTPGQGLSPLQEFEDEPNAPVGYRWRGEQLEYIPGGPADPHVAGGLAGARRAPPRPRQSAAPSGPWQRYGGNR